MHCRRPQNFLCYVEVEFFFFFAKILQNHYKRNWFAHLFVLYLFVNISNTHLCIIFKRKLLLWCIISLDIILKVNKLWSNYINCYKTKQKFIIIEKICYKNPIARNTNPQFWRYHKSNADTWRIHNLQIKVHRPWHAGLVVRYSAI